MLVPALLLAAPCLGPAPGDVHVDEVRGFRIEVPEGWTTTKQDLGARGFALVLQPPGSIGQQGVTVTIVEMGAAMTADFILEKSRERVEQGGDEYFDYEEWEDELAGSAAPGLSVSFRAPSGEYRIVQSFLVADGRGFTLQRHAPVAEFDDHAEAFEDVVHTFALAEITEEGLAERRLTELVERCGSEVDWAESWEEAAARAREEDRLIVVVAFLVPGFSISDTPRTTIFMNEDIVDLVNARFVPLWYTKGMEAAFVDSYGMGGSTFGQALLLVTPAGEVVLETHASSNSDVAYPFLRAGLARNPEFTGPPAPADLAAVDRAERLVERGELEAALALLEEEGSGRAHLLRARCLRLQRRGEEALAAVASARAAGGESEAALLVDEAGLLMRAGQYDAARELIDRVIADHAESDEAGEARIARGLLDLRAGDRDAARARWRALADERPESRWGWQAAAGSRSTVLSIDVRPDLGWPDEALLAEILTFAESAPLPADRVTEAAEGAFEWLLAAQREDGSWTTPSAISKAEGMGANPFVDAVTALGGRALLRHPDDERARHAVRRAVAFLLGSIESREEAPPLVLFMDYMTWSDSMMLHFLADVVAVGSASAERVAPAVETLLADLSTRQVKDGGWSYYVTGDLEGSAAPAQSISFTTAAAVLALARVREVGFDVPDEMLDPAVSALERMRGEDGVFAYFLYAEANRAQRSTGVPGAVGRGPACELALMQAGKSTSERLRGALDTFLEHAPLYSAEQSKVLMHAGPDAQGCHYLFFDYTHAALAEGGLAPDRRTRAMLLELVLDCRQPDGSFLDTPIIGRPYGTAMALLAFDALGPEPAR